MCFWHQKMDETEASFQFALSICFATLQILVHACFKMPLSAGYAAARNALTCDSGLDLQGQRSVKLADFGRAVIVPGLSSEHSAARREAAEVAGMLTGLLSDPGKHDPHADVEMLFIMMVSVALSMWH